MLTTPLRIYLFQSPQTLLGDTRAKAFPTEKVRLLFYYLVLFRDRRHARQTVAGLLWGNCSEAQARHSLSTALWRLRQWLEELPVEPSTYLALEDGHISCNPSCPLWLDVADFEERIRWAHQIKTSAPAQAAAALSHAVELYRGDLMEGCYAEWCLAERNRLHELYLNALLQLMVYYGEQRNFAEAIEYGLRILRDDPLREEVHRQVIKLYALNQQPAEALKQYRTCQMILREELGIEPMPETQQLLQKLIADPAEEPSNRSRLLARSAGRDAGKQLRPLLQRMTGVLERMDAERSELAAVIGALEKLSARETPRAGSRRKKQSDL